MIYTYRCSTCDVQWDVTKRLADIDRSELCIACASSDTCRVPAAAGFTDSDSLGRRKAPREFRDFLKVIHRNTPGSQMDID